MFKNYLHHLETVRLGELLVKRGLINGFILDAALQTQQATNQKLGEILVQQGHITEQQLNRVLKQQRLMKTVATFLLASGVSAVTIPQILSPSTHLTPASVALQKSGESAVGGSSLNNGLDAVDSDPQRNTTQKVAYSPQFMNVALTDQAKPTADAPLIGFCHPLNGKGFLSQGNHGITHRNRMAYAYDLAASIGTPVYAMRSGKVVEIRDKYPDTGGGRSRASKFNYVLLEHDGGYRSVYVHLQQNFLDTVPLKKGTTVEAGQLIGYTGNSGWSSGPHIHLEVQKPGGSSGFRKTVPFAVSGRCPSTHIANNSSKTQ